MIRLVLCLIEFFDSFVSDEFGNLNLSFRVNFAGSCCFPNVPRNLLNSESEVNVEFENCTELKQAKLMKYHPPNPAIIRTKTIMKEKFRETFSRSSEQAWVPFVLDPYKMPKDE